MKKFPAFVDRIISAGEVFAGDAQRLGHSVGIALQKTAMKLLKWLKHVARSKPKYEQIVLIENLHFFAQTVGPRENHALSHHVEEARESLLEAVKIYIAWILSRNFSQILTS